MEIWKDIEGYVGKYQVSNLGNVKTFVGWKGRVMKQSKQNKGYNIVRLSNKNHLVHRLVAQAFIPNPENKPNINHKSGVKTDNRAENLEWVTQKENIDHSIKFKLKPDDRGEKSYLAKLTENEVYVIKGLLKYTSIRPYEIAKIFNVVNDTIYAIKNKKSWKHIQLEEK